MRKIFPAGLMALGIIGFGACQAAAITLKATPCADLQQFLCDNVASTASQKISIAATNGPATSTSGSVHTYDAKLSVTIDGVVYAGTATAVGGALAGRTVSYRYAAKNLARADGQPGQLDLDKLVLGITGVGCGRGKVCFSGSGVHVDVAGGTLNLH
jgi:hypothetical protein